MANEEPPLDTKGKDYIFDAIPHLRLAKTNEADYNKEADKENEGSDEESEEEDVTNEANEWKFDNNSEVLDEIPNTGPETRQRYNARLKK